MIINNFYQYTTQYNQPRAFQTYRKEKYTPFWGIQPYCKAENTLSKTLDKIPNFTVSEYKTLTQEDILNLREGCSKSLQNTIFDERIHDTASEYIKKYLDKMYGQGKYVVIVIGRSLSSIGKVLGYKIGEENVKQVPMSGTGRYLHPVQISFDKNNGGFQVLKQFLSCIGLEGDKISKSDKKFIIMDYCVSGRSLRGAKKLLTQPDILGKQNIHSLNVGRCITNRTDKNTLYDKLFMGLFKNISYVDRAYSLKDIPNAIVNTTTDKIENRLLRFKLLDNFMQKNKQM